MSEQASSKAMRYTETQQSQARTFVADLRSKGLISIPHTDDRRYLSATVHAVANLIADCALAEAQSSPRAGTEALAIVSEEMRGAISARTGLIHKDFVKRWAGLIDDALAAATAPVGNEALRIPLIHGRVELDLHDAKFVEALKSIDAHLIMAEKASLRGEHTDVYEQICKAKSDAADALAAATAERTPDERIEGVPRNIGDKFVYASGIERWLVQTISRLDDADRQPASPKLDAPPMYVDAEDLKAAEHRGWQAAIEAAAQPLQTLITKWRKAQEKGQPVGSKGAFSFEIEKRCADELEKAIRSLRPSPAQEQIGRKYTNCTNDGKNQQVANGPSPAPKLAAQSKESQK